MDAFPVSADAKMIIGAPSRPMPRERADALAALVASIDGIIEAHLPQCFMVGLMQEPAQSLVLSLDPEFEQQEILTALGEGLSGIIPSGERLNILPVQPNAAMLRSVREARCQIYPGDRPSYFDARPRPWWKFW